MPRPRRSEGPRPYHHVLTRYHTPEGKRCDKGTPGAVQSTVATETYYADLPPRGDPQGKPERVPLGTSDEGEAWEVLRRLLRERQTSASAPEPVPPVDPLAEAVALPLEDHVERWHEVVLAGGTKRKWAGQLRRRVLLLAATAKWSRIDQISTDSCILALGKLQAKGYQAGAEKVKGRAGKGKQEPGLGAQTRNHYRAAIKQFCRWLVGGGKLARYPLAGVSKVPIGGDVRHARRVPTADEVKRLFDHLADAKCPDRCGMSGPRRALGYQVAMTTGLRAQEVRALTPSDFDLVAGQVTAWAVRAKAKVRVEIPLPPWLVADLTRWLGLGGGLWERFPDHHPGRLLRDDLEAAGVPYRLDTPDGPAYVDFHALRHFYVTSLVNQPGTDLRTLLELARLTDPDLLLRTYGHARKERLRKVVDQLPRPGGEAPNQG